MSDKLNEIYKDIKRIDTLDKCTISEAVCKFVEESGELIREINKTTGRKIISSSKEQILADIKEEAADTFQNLLLICSRFDITMDELCDGVLKKNIKWESQIGKRQEVRNATMNENNGNTFVWP